MPKIRRDLPHCILQHKQVCNTGMIEILIHQGENVGIKDHALDIAKRGCLDVRENLKLKIVMDIESKMAYPRTIIGIYLIDYFFWNQ